MNNTNQSLKTVYVAVMHISRLAVGAVFAFSGFVKAIDPLGFTYKIEDYLTAFGGFFTYFTPLAFAASIILTTVELVIGLNLLFSVKTRLTGIVALLFMIFYAPLTFYIWLTNPVTDCGCFGDALIISNGQTFAKNLVLLILVIAMLITLKGKKSIWQPRIEFITVLIFIAFGVGLSVYAYRHLPMIDFRPYKIGTNIIQAMEIPEGAAPDMFETTFIYEKDGVQQEFTLENYPADDSLWTFVDQKTKLVSEGYKPPIHDFAIIDKNGDDLTYDALLYEGYSYFLAMYDLKKSSIKGAQIAEKFYRKYKNTSVKFYALTASGDDEIAAFKAQAGVTFPFYKTDPIQLKTMIRANPGLVLIKNGTVEGKWNWRDFE